MIFIEFKLKNNSPCITLIGELKDYYCEDSEKTDWITYSVYTISYISVIESKYIQGTQAWCVGEPKKSAWESIFM